jgi:DNA-directed RNA polymerase subunit RPC12/RpoP
MKKSKMPRCPKCGQILTGIVHCKLGSGVIYRCSVCEKDITEFINENIDEETLKVLGQRNSWEFEKHHYKNI